MKAKELVKLLEDVDGESEVIVVIYTEDSYLSGYIDRIDPNVTYNSVTGEKLGEDDSVVEITTTTKVK